MVPTICLSLEKLGNGRPRKKSCLAPKSPLRQPPTYCIGRYLLTFNTLLQANATHCPTLNNMSTPEKQAPKADNDIDDDAVANGDDNGHDEAAEILSDLVQNQVSVSSTSAADTQIIEAQTTALQQLLQQGGASAAAKQKSSMQSLLDAAMKGNAAAQQQLMGQADATGEKKHLFWDTQVSNARNMYCNHHLNVLSLLHLLNISIILTTLKYYYVTIIAHSLHNITAHAQLG